MRAGWRGERERKYIEKRGQQVRAGFFFGGGGREGEEIHREEWPTGEGWLGGGGGAEELHREERPTGEGLLEGGEGEELHREERPTGEGWFGGGGGGGWERKEKDNETAREEGSETEGGRETGR